MSLVEFPWDRVPSDASALKRLPPFRATPLVLWNIGEYYVAFNHSAELLASTGMCPLLKSKLNNRVVQWAFISRDTDLSHCGKLSTLVQVSILLVN